MTTDQLRPDVVADDAYEIARKRAEDLQGLWIHLFVYAIVNAGLFGINWLTLGSDGPWWAVWPLLGWGIAVVIHVAVTLIPAFSPAWVDRRAARSVGRR